LALLQAVHLYPPLSLSLSLLIVHNVCIHLIHARNFTALILDMIPWYVKINFKNEYRLYIWNQNLPILEILMKVLDAVCYEFVVQIS